MRHLVGGVLLLLLAWPASGSNDKPKGPTGPRAEFDALYKEYREAEQELLKGLREGKTPEEQQKRINEGSPRLGKAADKFVALAEKYPKDVVALDALSMVLAPNLVGGSSKTARPKALELLARDHVANEKVGGLIASLRPGLDTRTQAFLRAVLEKNPNKEAKAEAALALAQGSLRRAAARSPATPGGAKFRAEADAAVKELVEKHLANLKPERLQNLCRQMTFSTDAGSEALLRAMQKYDKREVQGLACLTLAQVLKGRADQTGGKDAKAAELLRKEAEELFTRAAEKYGDVKTAFRGTVGEKAKSELYELRHLAIGKEAPDVEGEDQDSKKFKLSDYRGKVVLLDFWSQF